SVWAASLTSQPDIVIASPVANRNRNDLEGIIGFFVNTLILRMNCSTNVTFRNYLSQAKQICLKAYEHQDVPFEKVIEALQIRRDLKRAPLSQMAFSLQKMVMRDQSLGDVKAEFSPIDTKTAKTDLTLFMLDYEEYLEGLVEYNTDLFDEKTVAGFMAHFQGLLDALVQDPDQTLLKLVKKANLPTENILTRTDPLTILNADVNATNLTANQMMMWFGQKLYPQTCLYNTVLVCTLHEPVHLEVFELALQHLIDTSDSLRMVFQEINGVPQMQQKVHMLSDLTYLDLTACADPTQQAQEWIHSHKKKVLDITQRCFECALIKLSHDKYFWYINMHHIITDGRSHMMAYVKLTEYYRALIEGEDLFVDNQERESYQDYIAHEHFFSQTPRHAAARAYWDQELKKEVPSLIFYGRD
ncbi:MAG: hypothetical protein KC713_10860, partial [Candidatus Omnitrophica bacterium]|nr:hypothetical protein [Candidatus Omnitrophota bacterium]